VVKVTCVTMTVASKYVSNTADSTDE